MSRSTALGFLVVAVGLLLRLWGTKQGYPGYYGHVDEIGVMASVWNFFRSATLLPTEFTYPALYSYWVAGGLILSSWLGLVSQQGDTLSSLVFTSFADPAWAALVGRWISALASALTIPLVYRLGTEAWGRRVGGLGALFTLFSYLALQRAHMALPDSLMALWALLCFYWAWRILSGGQWWAYGLAGLFAGLAAATKYNGVLIALSIPAAHWLRHRATANKTLALIVDKKLVLAVVAAPLALFLGSPYLLLTWGKYSGLVQYQLSSLGFTLGQSAAWWWILREIIKEEWVLGMAMLAGLGWGIWRRQPLDVLLWAAWLPSFLYIGTWTRESLHYLLHFSPLLSLAAARCLLELSRWGGGGRWSTWLGPILALACLMPNLYRVVEYDRRLTYTDTRERAAAWIEANLPAGTKLAMTWLPYAPQLALVSSRESIERFYRPNPHIVQLLHQTWQAKPAYHLTNLEVWLKEPQVPKAYRDQIDLSDPETRRIFSRGWRSPTQLRKMGVEYIVLPVAVFERYFDRLPPAEGTAAHFRFLINSAYFTLLTNPDQGLVEQVAKVEAGALGRGDPIYIFRLLP